MAWKRLIQEVRCAKCKRTSEVDVTKSKDPFQPIGKNWTCGKPDCSVNVAKRPAVTTSCGCMERWLAAGNALKPGAIIPCEHIGQKSSTVPEDARRKYHNEPTKVDGIKFASKKEANRYGELKLMVMAGEIRDLAIHPSYEIRVNGDLICRYEADFEYANYKVAPARTVVEDTKGVRTQVFKLKKKLMKACLGIEVVEV